MGDEAGIKKAARYAHAAWFENAPASILVADKDQLTGSSGDKQQDLGHSASWWISIGRIDTEYLGINGVGIFKKE